MLGNAILGHHSLVMLVNFCEKNVAQLISNSIKTPTLTQYVFPRKDHAIH